MVRKISKIFYIILLTFLCYCQNNNNNNQIDTSFKINDGLVNSHYKSFQLDSLTIPYTKSIQYLDLYTIKYFFLFNSNTNSIYFYNYESSKIERIWKPLHCINNINFDGFYVHNLDSIFLYTYFTNILYLFDSKGELTKTYNLSRDMRYCPHPPAPQLCTTNPLLLYRDNFILTGFIAGEYKNEKIGTRPVGIKYNLSKKEISYFIDYPSIYRKHNWGSTNFRAVYHTFNQEKLLLIISFPASHQIVIYDLKNDRINSIYSGKYGCKNIKYYSQKKGKVERENRIKYYYTNPIYDAIYYDKYRNLYYRFFMHPLKEDYHYLGNQLSRLITIIILNEKFQIIGEIEISNHNPQSVFITKEGLHIQKFSRNEGHILFSVFTLDEVKK